MAVVVIEAEAEAVVDIEEGEDKDVIIHTDVMIMVVDDTRVGIGDMMIAVRIIYIYDLVL